MFSRQLCNDCSVSEDDTICAAQLARRASSAGASPGVPSAEALSATMLLLEACLSTHHMPTLQEVVKQAQEQGDAQPIDVCAWHVVESILSKASRNAALQSIV